MQNIDLTGAFVRALKAIRLDRVMARVDYFVKSRTERGEFLPGSSPGAGQYSTTPFARPAGGLTSAEFRFLEEGGGTFFQTSTGSLWVIVEGGYKALRDAGGYQTANVDLRRSGALLDATRHTISYTETGIAAEYGYLDSSDAEAARLADIHQNLGAGKGKTIRKFVGLLDEEEGELVAMVEGDYAGAL